MVYLTCKLSKIICIFQFKLFFLISYDSFLILFSLLVIVIFLSFLFLNSFSFIPLELAFPTSFVAIFSSFLIFFLWICYSLHGFISILLLSPLFLDDFDWSNYGRILEYLKQGSSSLNYQYEKLTTSLLNSSFFYLFLQIAHQIFIMLSLLFFFSWHH